MGSDGVIMGLYGIIMGLSWNYNWIILRLKQHLMGFKGKILKLLSC